MSLKKISIFLFLMFSLMPIQKLSAQTENVGIIPSNIWYSKDPFEAGDKIKIYTVVYNPDKRELSGTVIFFNNNVFLGKNNFTVPPKSIEDVSIDWTVTVGDHVIFAKIENAKFLISPGKYEEIYIVENKTEESKRNISVKIGSSETVSNVKKIVAENTPSFVTEAIDNTTKTLESVRESGEAYSTQKKEEVQKELTLIKEQEAKKVSLSDNKIDQATEENKSSILLNQDIDGKAKEEIGNRVQKPFKYLQLFFLTLFSFIFSHQVVFYILLVAIAFFILRFLWRLIF